MVLKIGGIEIDGIRFNYSGQAEALISQLKNFDRVKFQKWYLNNLPVGSANLSDYIINVLCKEELIMKEAERMRKEKEQGQEQSEKGGDKDGPSVK